MREYYDRWEEFRARLSWRNKIRYEMHRRVLHGVDRYLLTRNVERVFALSKTVQARLTRWGSVPSEVVYPPPPQRPYRCDCYDDYLFVVSRLTPLKRIGLIIEALAQPAAAGVRCLIAGDGEQAAILRDRIEHFGMADRVTLLGRVSDAAVLDYLARCRAVCFPPVSEDYGFVTVEAFASRKAVITCTDSGGPAELVESGVNGLVCAPTPFALANAIRTMMSDVELAQRYGAAAQTVAGTLTWEETVGRLVVV
jgi:glycosyltransferase involved in cell wall biosynthesis